MLHDIIRQRILILDGAMGTMIQRYGLQEADYRGSRFASLPGQQKGNNDLLTLSAPHVIEEIHRKYLEAGADIIETNTFNAQRISMADYHLEAYCREMNLEAARLARRLADEYAASNPLKPRFVAGSVGPTNKTCSMSPDVDDPALRTLTFDDLVSAYREQMEALLEGGVDALLIETIFDTLNAKAALYAAEETFASHHPVPLMLSVTIADKGGRTLSGQTLAAFLASVSHAPIFSVGLNCSFGAADMKPFLRELAQTAPYYISAYPNAGLPNSLGAYDQTPDDMAGQVREFVEEGLVNILGGCCGTTDAYIARYPEIVAPAGVAVPPRVPPVPDSSLTLSGLEALRVTPALNFLNIGERCNVAGSRKFLRLIKERQYDEAVSIARSQVEAGAQVLDINMDDGLLDARGEMTHFLNLLAAEPEVARVPFMIDSSKWEVIEAALKCVQGKCIVNSISLKEGEEIFLQRATIAHRMGAAMVVMAFDEEGQATTYERRISICERAYNLLTERVGVPPSDIIFDPNVLAVATGMHEHDAYAADFIRTVAYLHNRYPHSHISGGISNLSFSFRGNNYIREAMHAVFLYHAIAAGMDMGIVNPATHVAYEDIPGELLTVIEDVILYRSADAGEQLLDRAAAIAQTKAEPAHTGASDTEAAKALRLSQPVGERLKQALCHGDATHLAEDLTEALQAYPQAVDIIEGPLMDGMNEVGDRFGAGKMFLPQVVKAARTMKQAVDLLQPALTAGGSETREAGRILLATVKGDVHDIGKNIVGVVLGCNSYEVVDLGVMCPASQIVEAAVRERVDMVGLSGLITPSLDEMATTVRAMQAAGLRIPICVGGATTSRLHTALRLAPLYDGPVLWTKDASQIVPIVAHLMDPERRTAYLQQVYASYQQLRDDYAATHTDEQLLPLTEARQKSLHLFD